MSAESPRKSVKMAGNAVRPQPISDKSVLENVYDFFQDITYTSQPDDKEKIHWVRFEQADINDLNSNPGCDPASGIIAPLVLILGYANGIQIWIIPASGEAQEVLSLRQGPVRHVRLLVNPSTADQPDAYCSKRPLIVMSDASSAGQPYCSVKFISLRTGDEVNNIPFTQTVTDVQCNDRVLVVSFSEKIVVYDACRFKERFWITACYPAPGIDPNPIALGSRWLAYADKMLVPVHQSCGGMSGDGNQSYKATVIHAAKTITKGLTAIGETLASSITGNKAYASNSSKKSSSLLDMTGCRPGVVTIVDVQGIVDAQVMVQDEFEGTGLVAHFPAHVSEPVTAMAFDPSGMMLLTADNLGHSFHLFRIMAHPWSCSHGAVHHLYTLQRGDTTAKIQSMTFTLDSRWVSVTTLRGTTHLFPITTYGGPVNVRTHMSQRVVNKASRFHRSAGLEDIEIQKSGRDSPVHGSSSPGSSPGRHIHDRYRHSLQQSSANNNMNNPRLPPYPHSTPVDPLAQIHQSSSIPVISNPTGVTLKSKSGGGHQGASAVESICVAAVFAPSRGWVAGSPNPSKDKADDKRPVDSLFIINWTGTLIEYIIEPHPKSGIEKVTDESPLEATVTPRAQWCLARSTTAPEVKLPLSSNSPLLMSCDAVLANKAAWEFDDESLVQQGFNSNSPRSQRASMEHQSSDSSSDGNNDAEWLSQVEIVTHAGPHRRLWMGPQFSFKTFQSNASTNVLSSNSPVLLSESTEYQSSGMDVVHEELLDLQSLNIMPARSNPMIMPASSRMHCKSSTAAAASSESHSYSTFIEALDSGSFGQSPGSFEARCTWPDSAFLSTTGAEMAEEQLKEHLADAMTESPRKDFRDTRDLDALSTSSESSRSNSRGHSYSARSSSPRNIEHMLVFPSGSPDSN